MRRISQNDPRWCNTKIGRSQSSIGDYGCLITSLCMIWSKFHYKAPIPPHFCHLDPDEAAKTWTFVGIPHDKNPHYLSWSSDFDGMDFVWRNWSWIPDQIIKDPRNGKNLVKQKDLVKSCMKSKDYGVVFQVQTKKGLKHWLAGWWWGVWGMPVCHDPWDGHILYKPWGWLGKYSKCTGFAILKKEDI